MASVNQRIRHSEDIIALQTATIFLGKDKVAGIMGCRKEMGASPISCIRNLVNELVENGLGNLAVSIMASICDELGASVIKSSSPESWRGGLGKQAISEAFFPDSGNACTIHDTGVRRLLEMVESEMTAG